MKRELQCFELGMLGGGSPILSPGRRKSNSAQKIKNIPKNVLRLKTGVRKKESEKRSQKKGVRKKESKLTMYFHEPW